MKSVLVSCLLCISLDLSPALTPVNNNNSDGNLEIENKESIEVTVPCISIMDESPSLPDGYILPDLEDLTPSIPNEEVPDSISNEDSPSVSDEEKKLSQEEFNQIQRQNFIDRSFEPDFEIEYNYNNYIYPLAKIIFAEAGSMGDEHQRYVGYVVMNRVKSIYFPNTIEAVFFTGDAYAESSRERYNNECVTEQCIKNAEIVIGEYFSDSIPVSPAMVYQAEFKQGVEDDYIKMGNTYFCYDQRIIDDLNSTSDNFDDPELQKDTNK